MTRLTVILLAFLVWVPSLAQAAVIETNEWNNRTQTGWNYSTPAGNPTLDAAPAGGSSPSGGTAIRGNFSAGTYTSSVSGGASDYTITGDFSDLYFGVWIKFSNPFDFHPIGTKIMFNVNKYGVTGDILPASSQFDNFVINASPGGTALWATMQLWYKNCPVCTYNKYPNRTNVALVRDRWYWLEAHAKMNTVANGYSSTFDGVLEVWLDDVLVMQHTDVLFATGPKPGSSTNTWGLAKNTPILGGGGTNVVNQAQYMWYDHNVISTTRIGRPGGGTVVPDTTPPTTPTNLLATASGANVSVSWTASTDAVGVSNYSLLRCLGNACTPSTVLTTINAPTTFFTDNTVVAGSIYVYSVKAVDGAGNFSSVSNTSQITAPTVFRHTLYTDNFNRADTAGDIGADWTPGYTARTNLGITSNALRTITTATVSLETFTTTGAIGDQWAQATITSLPSVAGSQTHVLVRAANAATESYYSCRLQADTPRTIIEKRSAGTGSNLQTTAAYDAVWVAGDKIRCEATGAAPVTIKFYRIAVNGVETLVLSDSTDSAFATGKAGVRLSSVTSVVSPEMDDFAVGDFQSVVASAAPTFDAVSSSAAGNVTNSITWAHTVGSGTNRLLAVCLAARDSTTAGDVLVSSVTANGLALTKAKEQTQRVDDYFAVSLWYLVNPGAGTNTIVATWGGAPSGYGVGSGISVAGVNQITPIDATSGAGAVGVTASTTTTTVADHAMIVDCVALRANPLISIGGSQTSRVSRDTTGAVDAVGISTVNDKTPAGAQATTWTQNASSDYALAAMSLTPASVTPVVEPTIIGLVIDPANTGVNLTYGPTTPSFVRFYTFLNSGALPPVTSTVPIASITAGRYDTVFPAGYDGVCVFPINAVGVENSSQSAFYRCASLTGIVASVDITPATMTQVLPSGTLNKDTATTTFVVSSNKLANMRWDTTDTTYDLMANAMNCVSLSCSASTGNILSNGTTTHIFTRAQFTNVLGNTVTGTTSLDVAITVAGGVPTDTTAPTAPSNLTSELLSQAQVKLTWTASTDAVGVTGYQALIDTTGLCATFIPIGLVSVLTETIQNLTPNSTVSFTEKAFDAAGNVSAASNCVTVTTGLLDDVVPPSAMLNLQGQPYTESVVLTWDQMTDNLNNVTAIIEQCQGAGCTGFTVASSNIGNSTLIPGLSHGTLYRFRGIGSDGRNVSTAYSSIIDVTTATVGLSRPRLAVPFGNPRLPLALPRLPLATPRIPIP